MLQEWSQTIRRCLGTGRRIGVAAGAVVAMLVLAPTALAHTGPFNANDVSCSGSFCAAVGNDQIGTGEAATSSDGGATWSTATDLTPHDGDPITNVSCGSGPFCAAFDQNYEVLSYSGGKWSAPAPQNPNDPSAGVELTAISCVSSTFCAAVDRNGDALTYNGASWSSPSDIDGTNALSSVSCATAQFCVAVDGHGNLLTYSGSSWSTTLSEGPNQSLNEVSCPTSAFCMVAGYAIGVGPYYVTYNDSTWSSPTTVSASLESLTCASSALCVATIGTAAGQPALVYTAGSWGSPTTLPGPQGAGAPSYPKISCPIGSSSCTAVSGNIGYDYIDGSWKQEASIASASGGGGGGGGGGPTPPPAPSGAQQSASGSSNSATGTATAATGGSTVTATGYGALTLSRYGSDPVNGTPLGSTGRYVDVLLAKGSTFSTLTVRDCNLNGGNTIYWRDGNAWAAVDPQSYSAGCATATLSSTSSPTIAQLTGTVFAVAYTPKASISNVRVSGTKLTMSLKCSGKAKSSCKVTLRLLGPGKKAVIIGTASNSVTAGKRKTAEVSLNAAGKRMLAAKHTLKATLTVVQVGVTVSTHTVTFKKAKPKHKG
jgi:hypothetical protein